MKRVTNEQIRPGTASIIVCLTALCALVTGCTGVSSGKATPTSLDTGGRPTPSVGGKASKNIVSVLWEEKFGFVRIEHAEVAARGPNDQPVSLTTPEIRSVLSQLQVETGGKSTKSVFSAKELDDVAHPIALALAKAGPNEDVTFAVAGKKGPLAILNKRFLTTGRLFYNDGQLNLIFGIVHGEFESQYEATGYLRPFTPGSRKGRIESRWEIISRDPALAYASSDRKDWVRIAQLGQTPLAQAAQPAVKQTPSRRVVQEVPSVSTPGETDYLDLEKRLEVLKRLRSRDLITEDEYHEKRSAILDRL